MSTSQELESTATDLVHLRNELLNDLLKKNSEKSPSESPDGDKLATGQSAQHDGDEDEDEELELLRLEALKAKRSLSKTLGSENSSSFEQEDIIKRSAPGRFRYDRESDADDEDDDNDVQIEESDNFEDGVDAIVSGDEESSSDREADSVTAAESAQAIVSDEFLSKQTPSIESKSNTGRDKAPSSYSSYSSQNNLTYNHSQQAGSSYQGYQNNFGQQRAGGHFSSNNYQRNYYQQSQATDDNSSTSNFDLRNLLVHKRSHHHNSTRPFQNYAHDRLSDAESSRRLNNKSPSPAELSYSEPITKPIEIAECLPPRSSRFQKFQTHQNNHYHHAATDYNNSYKRASFNNGGRPGRGEMMMYPSTPRGGARSPNDKSNFSSSFEKYSTSYSRRDRRSRSRSRSERKRSPSSDHRRSKTRKYNSSRSSGDGDSGTDRSPTPSRKKLRSAILVPQSSGGEGKSSIK